MGKHNQRERRKSKAKESTKQLRQTIQIQQTIMRPSQSHLKRPLRTTVMATELQRQRLRRDCGERERYG